MSARGIGFVLAAVSVLLLLALVVGGTAGTWIFVLLAVPFPLGLIALATAGGQRSAALRRILLALALLMDGLAAVILLLADRPLDRQVLGLPMATALLLLLGVVPLLVVPLTYALGFGTRAARRSDANRGAGLDRS